MLIHLAWGRHHIDCLDSRAFADESGARCRCAPGYAPPEPCQIGDRSCGCYSCKSEYSEHHRSLDGQKCTACPKGETADEAGVHCAVRLQRHCFGCFLPRHLLFAQNSVVVWSQCSAGHYNSTEIGVITCTHEKFVRRPFSTQTPSFTLHPYTAFHCPINTAAQCSINLHCLPKHCLSLLPKHCRSVLHLNTVFHCSNQTLPLTASLKHCFSLLRPDTALHCSTPHCYSMFHPKIALYCSIKHCLSLLHPNTAYSMLVQTLPFTAIQKLRSNTVFH